MLIIFSPNPGTPEHEWAGEYPWKPREVRSIDAELLEELGGESWSTWSEFGVKFMNGSMKAQRAALWLLLRKKGRKGRFPEFDIPAGSILVTWDSEEKAQLRAAIELEPDMTDEDRERALAQYEDNPASATEILTEDPGDDLGKGEGDDSGTASP